MVNRQEHNEHFTMIDNAVLNNVNLSWEARGFLAYLLSLPDDWSFSLGGLIKRTGSSRSVILRMLQELQAAGYVVINRHKDSSGRFTKCTWDIYEHAPIHTAKGETDTKHPTNTPQTVHSSKMPLVETTTSGENHNVEKPEYGKPDSGKTTIWKNEPLQSTKEYKVLNIQSTKDKENIQKKFVPPTLEEVQAYCEERNNGIDPEAWYAYYKARGFKLGKGTPMKDWKAAVITWEKKAKENQKAPGHCQPSTINNEVDWNEVLRMAGGDK